jgi:uncharacterized YccA/Bax inhibitor family protein
MRVTVFCGKIKPEFLAVFYHLLSQLDIGGISLLNDFFKQNRAQRGVQFLSNILQ